jgi:hypothetical protein
MKEKRCFPVSLRHFCQRLSTTLQRKECIAHLIIYIWLTETRHDVSRELLPFFYVHSVTFETI